MSNAATVLVPLPSDRSSVRAILVQDRKDPANVQRLARTAPQDLIDAVLKGRRVKGWDPVVLAEVEAQVGSPAPMPAVTLASLLDEAERPAPEVFRSSVVVRDDSGEEIARYEDASAALASPLLAPEQPISRDWAVQTVEAAGAARAAADEATCAKIGIALPPAFFALGTTLVDIGVDNARKARADFEALPPAFEAMQALADEVAAEDRKSVAVGLSDLKLTPRGEIARETEGRREGFAFGLEADAARQLQTTLRQKLTIGGDPGIVTGLEFPDPGIVANAAATWNRYTTILQEKERKGTERKQVTLLTRMVEQPAVDGVAQPRRRQAFAAVSDRYGECDAGKIAIACKGLVKEIEVDAGMHGVTADIRAEVLYDRRRVSIDLLTHTTIQPDAQVVGDVFRTGLRVRSSDTGDGSLTARSVAFRVACRNYTVVAADGSVTRIRHIGKAEHLLERLEEALRASSGALAAFAIQWGKACGRDAARDLLRGLETERKRRDELAILVDTLQQRAEDRGALWQQAQQQVLDGIYRSILEQHNLAPAKQIEEEVTHLRGAYFDPRNVGGASDLSPAAIANGLTLRAQAWGRHTADGAETLAGRIVSGDEVLAWIGAPAARA